MNTAIKQSEHYTLGFIGIGLMGKPMTLKLLQAGYQVNVWNRSQDKLEPVIAAGAKQSEDIQTLAAESDIIIFSLADTNAVEQMTQQILSSANCQARLIIDTSSIHPEITKKLATTCALQNIAWVDAPVSGGTVGAEQGMLAIMAGGEKEQVETAKQILAPLYQRMTHMGGVGSGQMTKICNQMIVSCNVMVIAEMMNLAKQAGVDSRLIPQALAGGFADSKPLQIVAPEMAAEQFEPIKWYVKTLLKDLNMATDVSSKLDQATPMSAMAAQLMQLHANQGYLEQDPSTLIKLFSE